MNNKNIIVLSDQLLNWQACNVSAFLGSGITNEIKGQPYQDKSDNQYLSLANNPILVYSADQNKMTRTLNRANQRAVQIGIFTFAIFDTSNDIDNRQTVAQYEADDLNLAGMLVTGDKKRS